jgi:hypothetical protein
VFSILRRGRVRSALNMIIILALIRRHTEYSIPDATIQKLALVVTVAAQVCLVILVSELFTEFYRATHPPRMPGTSTSASRDIASWWAGSGRRSVSPCSPRPC